MLTVALVPLKSHLIGGEELGSLQLHELIADICVSCVIRVKRVNLYSHSHRSNAVSSTFAVGVVFADSILLKTSTLKELLKVL